MSLLRYVTGDPGYYNAAARGVLSASSFDTVYPLANIKDGDPSRLFKFPTAGTDFWVSVDTSRLTGSNLDGWSAGSPVGWTKITGGGGTVTQDSVIRHGGAGSSAAFAKAAGGDVAQLTEDYTARAGEKLFLSFWIEVGAVPFAEVYVQNLATGKWLNASMAWQTAQTYASRQPSTGGVFTNFVLSLQAEDFLTVGGDTCTLRVTLNQSGVGNVWFDDVYLIPSIDVCSVHGHNLTPALAPIVQYSFDNAAWTTAATTVPRLPSFYATWDPVPIGAARYWRIQYIGTPVSPIWYGEVIFAQLDTALRAHLYGWPTRFIFDQIRVQTETGHVQTFKQAQLERRAIKLQFQLGDATQFRQLRDEWARRTFGGHYPMVVIPDDTDDLVIHGRLAEEWEATKHFLAVWSTDIVVAESGFPTVVA